MSELKQELLERLNQLGVSPKRSLGQNFLISKSVIEKIAKACEATKIKKWIEVGPGAGALTMRLRQNLDLSLIELDQKFAEFWREQNVSVIEEDALKVPWPELLDEESSVVGNLPYQIAGRLVVELSCLERPPTVMIFMFQKEVAQRITAKPKSADYGLLSVLLQWSWKIKLLLEAGPMDFYPKPNIASRVLVFETRARSRSAEFLGYLKQAFSQRRKKLKNNLKSFGADRVDRSLEALGLKESARAEELSSEEHFKLFAILHKRQ